MKKETGIIGLGRIGLQLAEKIEKSGYRVIGLDDSQEQQTLAAEQGVELTQSVSALIEMMSPPRVILLMLPRAAVDEVIDELGQQLTEGDILIDGADSYFKDSARRYGELKERGINFLDVGLTGNMRELKKNACLMVGGDPGVVDQLTDLFNDLSAKGEWKHVGAAGAGHFAKMVHDGVVQTLEQALAEGFNIFKNSEYNFWLADLADLFDHGSLMESKLLTNLHQGLVDQGEELAEFSGSVDHSGLGEWAVEVAKEMELQTPAMSGAYLFRLNSEDQPSYTGRLQALMRLMSGTVN